MTYDVFLAPSRFSPEPRPQAHPLTGETLYGPAIVPLSEAEISSIIGLLREVGAEGPDEYGCFEIRLADGGSADFFAQGLARGGSVTIHRFSPELFWFLFALARRGRFNLVPAVNDPVTLIPTEEALGHIPSGFPHPTACTTPEALGLALTEAWQNRRKRSRRRK